MRRGPDANCWASCCPAWGLFNLVEGVIDHHILGIHHVKAGSGRPLLDLAFLALGAVLLVVGILTARSGGRWTDAAGVRRGR